MSTPSKPKDFICPKCWMPLEQDFNPTRDCTNIHDECPYAKEIAYKLPNTRPQIKKHVEPKVTFKFEVEVEIDRDALSNSEYQKLKGSLGTSKGLKETVARGIDPLKSVKIKVRKID